MVIVAGHIIVGREKRDDYLDGCGPVVEQGRSAPGCLDFAISADLVDDTRINIFERWDSEDAVQPLGATDPKTFRPTVNTAIRNGGSSA